MQVEATPRTWGEYIPPAARVRMLFVVALVIGAYWGPINRDLIGRWLNEGAWSHGFIIPLFSLYILNTRRDELLRGRPRPNYLGGVIILASLAMYITGVWKLMMYPQALSIVGVVFGLVLLFGGWAVMRIAWFPVLFLLFAIPIPGSIYVQLTLPLREFASWSAAALMPLFYSGLVCEAQAVVIDYFIPGKPPGHLNVDEACSGMRSLMVIVTLGIAITYLDRNRPTWQRILMAMSCLPVALFCNMIRVTTTGLFVVYDRPDLARGSAHAMLGVLMIVLAGGLFFLFGAVLERLFVEDSEPDGPGAAAR